MVPIIKNFIPSGQLGKAKKIRRPGYQRVKTGIVVHSTANPKSTAINERNWLINENNLLAASWHVAVDDKQAVIAIPYIESANGTLSRESNYFDIQVEICESGDREQTLRNAIELIAYICSTEKINTDHIKQHADVQKKNCPRILRDTNRWGWFISEVQKEYDRITPHPITEWLAKSNIQFDSAIWDSIFKGGVKTVRSDWVAILLTRIMNK